MKIKKKYYFPIFLFILLAVLSVFKINGSSILEYKNYLDVNDSGLLLGKTRAIRSDEWLFYTPLMTSQLNNGFKQFNNNVGLGNDLFYTDAPFKSWITIFRPNSWAFFLMNYENAFAFRWWLRGFLLITASYLLFLHLTKQRIIFSILLSISLYYSAFFQWWYSSVVFEPISYGILIYLAIVRIINYKKLRELVIYGLILTYFLIAFAFLLYPPFQISVAFVILCLSLGYFLSKFKSIKIENWKKIFLTFIGVLMAVVSVLILFYFSSRNVLNIISNTSYPGKRSIVGGAYNVLHLLGGFFDIQILNNNATIPSFFSNNQSETSSFLMYSFLILPFIIFDLIKNIKNKINNKFTYLFLTIYYLISLCWILFGLPRIIAKVTFLNLIPENRMMIGIGFTNLILVVFYLFSKNNNGKKYNLMAILYSALIFVGYLYFGFYLAKNYPFFIQKPLKIIFISSFIGVSSFLLIARKKTLFILSLFVFSLLTSFSVNPLYVGLTAIYDNQLTNFITEIKKDNGLTVVYGGNISSQLLFANGINTLGGVHIYPQLYLWKKFDNDQKYFTIYNRFAHVNFQFNNIKEKDNIRFDLNQADSFTVFVNPCNKVFSELGVKYFVLPSDIAVYTKCLSLKGSVNMKYGKYFLYKTN